jgi:hypothetical protein
MRVDLEPHNAETQPGCSDFCRLRQHRVGAAGRSGGTIRAALTEMDVRFQRRQQRESLRDLCARPSYDYRGFPERSFADICGTLQRSLSGPTKRYVYALDIASRRQLEDHPLHRL